MSKSPRKGARRPVEPVSERGHLTGELFGLALLVAAVLSALALFTHDARDASWGAVGAGADEIANAVGPFGANLSYVLFEALGHVALAVPLVLVVAATLTFLRRRVRVGLPRCAGAVLLLLAAAALVHLFVPETMASAGYPAGGLLGRLLGTGLASVLGQWGAVIIAGALVATALLLLTQLSLHDAADAMADGTLRGARGLRERTGSWLERRSEVRIERRARRAQRKEEKLALRAEKQAAKDVASAAKAAAKDAAKAEPEPAIAKTARPPKRSWKLPSLGLSIKKRSAGAPSAAAEAAPEPTAPRAKPRRAPAPRREPVAAATPAAAPARASRAEPARSSESSFLADGAKEVAATADASATPAVGNRATIARGVHAAKRHQRDFRLPPTEILHDAAEHSPIDESELMACAKSIVDRCAEFGVGGKVLHIHPGPVVTTFELKPDAGVKLSRIVGLEDDLAMALKAESIRIDRIPGKSTVGIEVPNRRREAISFRELCESDVFVGSQSKLSMILGKTIDGAPYVADLTKMPHLLIAGSTGSGKSVALNSLITSMLFKATPDQVRFIMVDPKMLELGMYKDIPHLLTPVVTNPKLASNALKWGVREMEQRYALLAGCGVRNIEQYNAWVVRETKKGGRAPVAPDGKAYEHLPFIVIVIDELADLMMIAASDVEDSICRLAQMARAVGIHLILATQRPSVDVITGVIKANLPARIAMRVASKIDSRTIIDANGADQLLGKGDMLLLPSGSSRLLRMHGPYLSEVETQAICDHLRGQRTPEYDEQICDEPAGAEGGGSGGGHDDELFEKAARIVIERGEASTSFLQRRLKVGYSRAARLVDMLEEDGIVGPSEGSKVRKVLVTSDWFAEVDNHHATTGL